MDEIVRISSGNPGQVLIPLLALAIAAHLASVLETGQLVFGSQVNPEYAASPEVQLLRLRYTKRVWLHSLLPALALALLGNWNLGLGLFAVSWQGFQAGVAWWNAHMEALPQQLDPVKWPPEAGASPFLALAASRLVRSGPYALILAGLVFLRAQSEPAVFGLLVAALAACAAIGIGSRFGRPSRRPMALAAQYLLALVTVLVALLHAPAGSFPTASGVLRGLVLLAFNHFAFFGLKSGLVGYNPEWSSRPGFDHPPVEPHSITGGNDSEPSERNPD